MSKQKSRFGRKNIITSVSVSEEFDEIIKRFSLSPTEIFRKGMGVTLCSIGQVDYVTEINEYRLKRATEILKGIDDSHEIMEKLSKVKSAIIELEEQMAQLKKPDEEEK